MHFLSHNHSYERELLQRNLPNEFICPQQTNPSNHSVFKHVGREINLEMETTRNLQWQKHHLVAGTNQIDALQKMFSNIAEAEGLTICASQFDD